MNILFIGSSSPLSIIPLLKLIESGIEICAIASDESMSKKQISGISIYNENKLIFDIARRYHIPYITFNKNLSRSRSTLKELKLDLILVSCFARKLPLDIISLPIIGSFNIHPSLLPQFRGPSPIFWQLRNGINELAVTLHRMTENFDDGNIIKQKKRKKLDGLSYFQINLQVSELAADLLIECLPGLISGRFKEIPQNSVASNYQSFPEKKDYFLSTKWTAQHMYNFICAQDMHNQTFTCQINGFSFRVSRAHAFNMSSHVDYEYQINGRYIRVKCAKGFIECQLAEDPL